MNVLNYLTVDLFLYDLCQGFGRGSQQAEEATQRFWQRLYPEDANGSNPVPENAQIENADSFFSNYVELLKRGRKIFPDSVDGYYYPVKLGDTYALQVDSAGERKPRENGTLQAIASPPEAIQAISADILKNRIHDQHGELGESWLVWGQLSTPDQDADAAAQACYKSLVSSQTLNWQQDLIGKGSFDGATLYELEQLDTFLDSQNKTHHVLICLFPAAHSKAQLQTAIGKLHRHLIRLFHYRSKILWLYEQSRQLKGFLKEASDKTDRLISVLPDQMRSPQIDLKALQQHLTDALAISHLYETRLGYLKELFTAISTNLASYRDRTARMSATDETADLVFLDRFVNLSEEKFLRQIQSDSAAFDSALKPLGNFIQTIQGITDIERTQNERVLNQTVAIAGVGISAASLAASSIGDRADSLMQAWRPVPANQPPSVTNLWLSAALVLTVSLAIGILAAWVTAVLINQKANPSS